MWPITIEQVREARERIRPWLPPTPLRSYPALDAAVGCGIRILVKHENHNPTNAFKARSALSFLTALPADAARRGVVAATRGNHGLGLAWAGSLLGIPVTLCVPAGNNPEKNEAIRGQGARLIEQGKDYDEAVVVAETLVREQGLALCHSTNAPEVIAGAATLTLEILAQSESMGRPDALVLAVGGGSQAVGAMTVTRALAPDIAVYGVQAARASAIHDSWHAGSPRPSASADTFADGLATRNVYDLTFGALREALAGFVTVSEAGIASALRLLLRTTHNLVEGAGAAGLAGVEVLGDALAGRCIGIVISGSNIDRETLRRVVNGDI
ncbi:MAG TPA: pyridoxal-phosphate dependent enzyme [Candidatus Polarisedimenticolia bacterium]|nr:pyridoxal-phosphate dependent enzyme [Candidatus Polarisedimenticolia bacterium]